MKKLLALFLCLVWVAQITTSQNRAVSISADDLLARARAALAQTSGRIEMAGLTKPVEVLRDEWGVAHIYAQTTDDLFFAQGFVAAQDRLWQMEIWRRTGEGKLAEILGESAIERDRFARLMRYRGSMEAEWTSYAPDARQIIEAFVRGVNAFIDESRANPPIEFQLTGIKPDHWTPEACLTRMAGYVMTRNASSEVLRAQLARMIGVEKVDELLETDPPKKLEIPAGLDLEGIDRKILESANAASGSVSFANDGSNNWVIGGELTHSGKPILANDPHRAITLPSLRYMVHLVGPGWNVIGAGEPALPGVAAGHNERVGFGFTIVGIDQQDIYVAETSAEDATLYRYQNRWERMKTEREEIRVKGRAAPEVVELRFTRHGPVIYEDRARRRAYVLRWVGTEPGTAGYLASLSLNRARNWKEFLAALERWKVPSENLVYADVDGNIGWQAAGLTPLRRGWSGLLPVPGDGRYEWQGFLPLAQLPRLYYPARRTEESFSGRKSFRYVTQGGKFIATANHNILPKGYKHELGFEWAAPFRFKAIEEEFRHVSIQAFNIDASKSVQLSENSLTAREIVPRLFGVKVEDARLQEAVNLLLYWDSYWSKRPKFGPLESRFQNPPTFVLSKDSAAAALYEVWLTKLIPNVFKPRVSADVWRLIGPRFSITQLIAELKKNAKGPFHADPAILKIMLKSLEEAVNDLTARLGPDMKKWRWGDLHLAEFKHMLSKDDVTRSVFDLKSIPRGGDANTVNATAGAGFKQTHGASFREILDLADWDKSVAINVPGQSGQPESPHYADLLPLWAEGKYFPLLFSRKKIEQHTAQKLILEPKK